MTIISYPTQLYNMIQAGLHECHRVPYFYVVPLSSFNAVKDGAYYCYCAYVLHISRYSDFLSPMLTNTGIFLRGLKLSGESRA